MFFNRQQVFIYLTVVAALLMSGCDLFENEIELDEPQDFGVEDGYFIYDSNRMKIPWTRDRNYLSLEFHDDVSEKKLYEILGNHGLRYEGRVFPVKHIFARVVNKPAEEYYTTYEDSSQVVLGNRPEVKYALPVFRNEFLQALMLTDRILITFNDGLTEEEELAMLDSLKFNDHLIRLPFVDPPYLLQITKATTKDPLTLVNHYMETIKDISAAGPVYAFRLN
jgi:hypothetical protein